jgi:hypothetical protein
MKNLNKVILFAAILAFGFTNAQGVSFGVKAGVNLSDLEGDFSNTELRASFHIGGVVEMPIGQHFIFAPELLYSSQGKKSTFEQHYGTFIINGKEESRLDYIQLPLMVRYYIVDNFSLEAGPQMGFLIAGKSEFEATASGADAPIGGTETGSSDLMDKTAGIDYGLNLGLGYKMANGLFFQGRYNIGLANVSDFVGDKDFFAQNRVIQFSVGYMF